MKKLILLIIVAFAAISLVVIASRFSIKRTQTETASTSLSQISLSLDWTPNTNHTGIYVALAKGWYKDDGIDLRILPYSESVTPDVLVSNGKADFGISSTESVVANRALGQDVVSVASILQHNTSSLAVLADSNITRPKDLDGKVYGGFGAPSEEAVVNAIVKKDGGKGTVKNITLETGAMEALKAKRVDVVWIYDGWEGVAAKRDGVKLRTFPITKYGISDYYTPVIISSRKAIASKKEILKKFMAATKKGYEYAILHSEEAAKLLIDTSPKGTFPDRGLVIESQKYLSKRYSDKGIEWGWQDKKSWEEYPKFLIDAGAIMDAKGLPVKKIEYLKLYSNELLK